MVKYAHAVDQGFIQDFVGRGKDMSVLQQSNLGGVGACPPPPPGKFKTSENAFLAHLDQKFKIIVLNSFGGGGGEEISQGFPPSPHPSQLDDETLVVQILCDSRGLKDACKHSHTIYILQVVPC